MVHSGDGAWKGDCRELPVALMNMPRMEERRQLSTPSSRESDGAGMEVCWWPAAARHVVELERRRREKITEKLPHFGQTVVVKKRSWELQRQGAFEPTGEQVKYLTPVPEVSKGHAVLTDRGFVKVVSYTDVKTAFLNAPLCTVEESKKKLQALEDREEGGQQPMEPEVEEKTDPNRRERLVLMQPPRILIRLGLVQEGEMWMIESALWLKRSTKAVG